MSLARTKPRYPTAWRSWSEAKRWPAAATDLIEFAYWLGPPLLIAFSLEAEAFFRRPAAVPNRLLTGTTLLTVLLTAVFGKTIGEVARLWIFFIPLIVLGAAHALSRLRPLRPAVILSITVGLGLFWTFSLKVMQDFY